WGTHDCWRPVSKRPAVGARRCRRRPECRRATTGPAIGAVRPSWGRTVTGIVEQVPPEGRAWRPWSLDGPTLTHFAVPPHTEARPPMLSEQNRPIVEATLPVVGQHIGAIAGRFYEHLFAAHPELMD